MKKVGGAFFGPAPPRDPHPIFVSGVGGFRVEEPFFPFLSLSSLLSLVPSLMDQTGSTTVVVMTGSQFNFGLTRALWFGPFYQ